MKIITVGAGFIASHLPYPIVKDRIYPNYQSVNDFLDEHNPNILVNCIGYCGGANIDDCEDDKQRTFNANTILPIMLASACDKRNIRFIHIGSGCVFYGPSPWMVAVSHYSHDSGWRETDTPTPLSTYSKSKYACDLVLEAFDNTTILRIRMPISWKNEPRNLLSKLINYNQVVEIPNSITLLKDLSRSLQFVIDRELMGTFHIASPIPIKHSQILNEYKKHIPSHQFTSITPDELNTLTTAPRSNCILDSSKIQKAGFEFLNQDEELNCCIEIFAKTR